MLILGGPAVRGVPPVHGPDVAVSELPAPVPRESRRPHRRVARRRLGHHARGGADHARDQPRRAAERRDGERAARCWWSSRRPPRSSRCAMCWARSLRPVSTAALVIVFVIFMLLRLPDLRDRVISLLGSKNLRLTTEALDEAAKQVSQYLVMQTVINGLQGIWHGRGPVFHRRAERHAVGRAHDGAALRAVYRHLGRGGAARGAFVRALRSLDAAGAGRGPVRRPRAVQLHGARAVALWQPHRRLADRAAGGRGVLDVAVGTYRAAAGHSGHRVPRGDGQIHSAARIPARAARRPAGARCRTSACISDCSRAIATKRTQLLRRLCARSRTREVCDTVDRARRCNSPRTTHDRGALPDAKRLAVVRAHRAVGGRVSWMRATCRARRPAIPTSASRSAHPCCACRPRTARIEISSKLLALLLLEQGVEGAHACRPAGRTSRGLTPWSISALPPDAVTAARRACKALRQRWHDVPIFVGLWNATGDIERARQRLEAAGAVQVCTSFAECIALHRAAPRLARPRGRDDARPGATCHHHVTAAAFAAHFTPCEHCRKSLERQRVSLRREGRSCIVRRPPVEDFVRRVAQW